MSKIVNEGAYQRVFKHVVGIMMTQMTEKVGIKKHGKDDVAVLYDEFFSN